MASFNQGGDYLVAKMEQEPEPILQPMDPRNAIKTVMKANQSIKPTDFGWTKVFLPPEGKCYIVSLSTVDRLPDDGYMWVHPENKTRIPLQGGMNLVIGESLYGVKPGEKQPTISKMRYYIETGDPRPNQIQLIHYLSSYSVQRDRQVNPALLEQQRMNSLPSYPPQLPMRPPMPNPANFPPPNPKLKKKPPMKGVHDPRIPGSGVPHGGAPMEPKPQYAGGDELDLITSKEVALFRYMRNHDWMEDIFSPLSTSKLPVPEPYFSGDKLENLKELEKNFKEKYEQLKEQSQNDQYTETINKHNHVFSQLSMINNIEELNSFKANELNFVGQANGETESTQLKQVPLSECSETPFNSAQSPSIQTLRL